MVDEEDEISPDEKLKLSEFVVKRFNSIMLKLLKNADINMIYTSLFLMLF